ncbi:MAG TPA: polysaccharide deacetylase, partial [Alphaproteobacteria bacterium]|nr:polysaccharide deacetylase [Alphaproteobacteria bacterium]
GGAAACGPREFAIARDLGLRSAVTTRPGGLYARHRESLHALPRISLNGLFQSRRYIDVFATGGLFSLGRQS